MLWSWVPSDLQLAGCARIKCVSCACTLPYKCETSTLECLLAQDQSSKHGWRCCVIYYLLQFYCHARKLCNLHTARTRYNLQWSRDHIRACPASFVAHSRFDLFVKLLTAFTCAHARVHTHTHTTCRHRNPIHTPQPFVLNEAIPCNGPQPQISLVSVSGTGGRFSRLGSWTMKPILHGHYMPWRRCTCCSTQLRSQLPSL